MNLAQHMTISQHWGSAIRAPLAALSICVALGACTELVGVQAPDGSDAPPDAPARESAAPATEIETPARPSTAVAAHFQRVEARRLANGLLRTNPRPADLPFGARELEDTFVRIALYDEYTFVGNRLVEQQTPAPLRRWRAPVRMRLQFGDSVPDAMQQADTRLVNRFAARLGNVTGHPVSVTQGSANFHVLVLDEAERRAIAPQLRRLIPGIDRPTQDVVVNLPLNVSCVVLAFSRSGTNTYTDAVAVIRAELPDLSRRACYYEELAQGMGLPNDSPRARPSLFNDAAEFAVLTELDEHLLRILYDQRLRPGMRESAARPIVRRIASEMMGGES